MHKTVQITVSRSSVYPPLKKNNTKKYILEAHFLIPSSEIITNLNLVNLNF
jgi:hypothetical protein